MKIGKIISVSFVLSIIFATQVFAKMDTIKFGGAQNLFFPATLSVHVGDTVIWIGNYAFHIIKSDVIPPGAATFGPTTQSASTPPLTYVVRNTGTFNYECTIHASMGMVGSFTAAQADVSPESSPIVSLGVNYPNPTGGSTIFTYSLATPAQIDLKIFDITGKEVAKVITASYKAAGSYEAPYDASALPSGTYTYQLQAGDAVLTRQLVIAK